MWYGSKYSMAVLAEMLCLFSRSLPPVLSCDWFSPDFQQWETSVEQLMLNALLTARLSPKVKRGSPYHPTVMTEQLVCFSFGFFFSAFCPSVLKMQSSAPRHDPGMLSFHSLQALAGIKSTVFLTGGEWTGVCVITARGVGVNVKLHRNSMQPCSQSLNCESAAHRTTHR